MAPISLSGNLPTPYETSFWTRVRKIERRQWWLWATAIVITLVLTAGMASFSYMFEQTDPNFSFTVRGSIRGLVGSGLSIQSVHDLPAAPNSSDSQAAERSGTSVPLDYRKCRGLDHRRGSRRQTPLRQSRIQQTRLHARGARRVFRPAHKSIPTIARR